MLLCGRSHGAWLEGRRGVAAATGRDKSARADSAMRTAILRHTLPSPASPRHHVRWVITIIHLRFSRVRTGAPRYHAHLRRRVRVRVRVRVRAVSRCLSLSLCVTVMRWLSCTMAPSPSLVLRRLFSVALSSRGPCPGVPGQRPFSAPALAAFRFCTASLPLAPPLRCVLSRHHFLASLPAHSFASHAPTLDGGHKYIVVQIDCDGSWRTVWRNAVELVSAPPPPFPLLLVSFGSVQDLSNFQSMFDWIYCVCKYCLARFGNVSLLTEGFRIDVMLVLWFWFV